MTTTLFTTLSNGQTAVQALTTQTIFTEDVFTLAGDGTAEVTVFNEATTFTTIFHTM